MAGRRGLMDVDRLDAVVREAAGFMHRARGHEKEEALMELCMVLVIGETMLATITHLERMISVEASTVEALVEQVSRARGELEERLGPRTLGDA